MSWRVLRYHEARNEYHCVGFGFFLGFVVGLVLGGK